MFGYQIKTNENNDFHKKYLKYKEKYLKLKAKWEQTGGAKPMSNILKGINLFVDPDMELYLNPIYGVIMCESGYIKNNFYLHESNFINTEDAKIISQVSREIPGLIQPTKEIMQKIKPDTIGKYIGLLYVSKSQWYKDLNAKSKALTKIVTSQVVTKEEKDKAIVESKAIGNLIKELAKANKENIFGIKPGTDNKNLFHIILYCLWWVANDKSGIKKYYEGINELFSVVNKHSPNQFPLINIPEDFVLTEFNKDEMTESINNPSFELIIAQLTAKSFNIFVQDYAKSYCSNPAKLTYADCGETTIRNLLNLISYDKSIGQFNVRMLQNLGAINEVIEYYNVFKTFGLQASLKTKSIYGEELTARDAWSKLIIFYANKNVRFVNKCSNADFSFELNSAMAEDGSKSNLLQVVSNLLTKVTVLNDISSKENNIKQIQDNTTNGIGKITIAHEYYGEIFINCVELHYYMQIPNTKIKFKGLDTLTDEQYSYYSVFNDIIGLDVSNYIWRNISADILPNLLNNPLDTELKNKLLELSLTSQYNPDTRKRIQVDVENLNLALLSKSNLVDQYSYSSDNFDFAYKLPNLRSLSAYIDRNIESIDLSPLCKINTIENNFLRNCKKLKSINLEPLTVITSIGYNFLANCEELSSIDLSPLSSVTKIGSTFMYECKSIKSIDLKPLKQLTLIDEYFLGDCIGLTNIDLSPFNLVTNVEAGFLSGCSNLENVTFTGLNDDGSISLGFSNVKTIGAKFLARGDNLKSIDLSTLTNLNEIGNQFLSRCIKIKQIDLTPLKQLKKIDTHFAHYCSDLESVDLSGLNNLNSIGNDFLVNCTKLKEVKLDGLTNLEKIGTGFLARCPLVEKIDLTGCPKLCKIGPNLLFGSNNNVKIICTELQKQFILINNPSLANKIVIVKL